MDAAVKVFLHNGAVDVFLGNQTHMRAYEDGTRPTRTAQGLHGRHKAYTDGTRPTRTAQGLHGRHKAYTDGTGHPALGALEGGRVVPSVDTQLSPFVMPSQVNPAFRALEHHSAAFFAGSEAAVFREK